MSKANEVLSLINEAKDPIYITQQDLIGQINKTFPKMKAKAGPAITVVTGKFSDGELLSVHITFGNSNTQDPSRNFRITKGPLENNKPQKKTATSIPDVLKAIKSMEG